MNETKINRISFNSLDIDEFACMLKNVDVENILMEKGRFKVNMTLIESPRVKISQFYINRKLIQRGGRATGYITFLIWDDKFSMNWRNKILSKNQIAVLWNLEHYSLTEGGIQGFPISVDEKYLIERLVSKGYPEMIAILKKVDSITVSEFLLQKLRLKIPWITQIKDLNIKEFNYLIEVELVDDLLNCLISTYENKVKPELLPQKFNNAIDYIHENLNEIVSVSQVSQFVNIPERTLRYNFEKKYNISPKDFIQKLRLNGVKKRLSGNLKTPSIYKIASEYNFWHMGQFARDYKHLFGELPSETLKRSRKAF